jgi:hypothetical protein
MMEYFRATRSSQPQRRGRPWWHQPWPFSLRFAGFIFPARLERSAPTLCSSLEHAKHFSHPGWCYAEAGAGSCTDGTRRGDKRVGPEINIQHRALGTFGQYFFPFRQVTVNDVFTVNDRIFPDLLNACKPWFFQLFDIIAEIV